MTAAVPRTVVVNGMSVVQLARQVQLVRTLFGMGGLPTLVSEGYAGIFYEGPLAPSLASGVRTADALVQRAAAATPAKVAFLGTDEEGGGVDRLAAVLGALPWQSDVPAHYTPAAYEQLIARHSAAMRNLGLTLNLAPVVDTAPLSNEIGDEGLRSFGDSAATASSYGRASLAGMQAGRVLAVVKHFPGLGHVNGNTDDGVASTPPLATLQREDLLPFQSLIDDGAGAVMVSNADVPGLTGSVPASVSPAAYSYLTGVLHFRGMTMTDSLAAGAISQSGYTPATAAVAAIRAGADLVLDDVPVSSGVTAALVAAVDSGSLPLSRLQDAVEHVLRAKGVAVTLRSVGAAPAPSPLQVTGPAADRRRTPHPPHR